MWTGLLEKIGAYQYRIPKSYDSGMRVDGIIYADERFLRDIIADQSLQQVAHVAHLPGIVRASLAMPDIHCGYGFCIGAVAATDIENGGVISPGGVGFDINCGVRLIRTNLTADDMRSRSAKLADILFSTIPSGVGSEGDIVIDFEQEQKVLIDGARWAVRKGFGVDADLAVCEEGGALEGVDPDSISERAYDRGERQLGTLGSGNHFIEVQVVDEVYNQPAADVFGLFKGQVVVMLHSGSRGFGHQICDEYVKSMAHCLSKYHIHMPDKQLACAPVTSLEGQAYWAAMCAAANYAWANRQILTHLVRESFAKVFGSSWQFFGMELVYDVAHNIARIESHMVDGALRQLCVHRKGAARAFGPGNPALPAAYRGLGQPVIIPGDMGRASYVLLGTRAAEAETFGSACHGAGRVTSRSQAMRTINAAAVVKDMHARGIEVRSAHPAMLAEEASQVYKNIADVVDVVDGAGIASKVCRMRPLCVVKG